MQIAIVVPAYNVASWIGDALASVLAQSHRDWVLTVVDDGSADATVEVAGGFADARIRLVRQRHRGVAAARNAGLEAPGGDAVLFLDADDWLAPDALERLGAALALAPEAVAGVARFAFVPERASRGERVGARSRPPASGDVLPRLLERNLFANGGHLLIRRAALARVGGFRPGLAYGEDWELWCRLAALGPFVAAPGREPALFVRQRSGGAMLTMASDPGSFGPCMDAIFGDPGLLARVGADRLAPIRRRSEAENAWIVGRELVRHGRVSEGRASLRRSLVGKPGLKRTLLLAATHALPLLPPSARGPFRLYPGVSGAL